MAAASSPVSAILRVAASPLLRGALADGPLTVERDELRAGASDFAPLTTGARPLAPRVFLPAFLPAMIDASYFLNLNGCDVAGFNAPPDHASLSPAGLPPRS